MDAPVSIEKCVVGIRTPSGGLVKAFDVRIEGEDTYVNYRDVSTSEAHGSYHASGQQHIKIGKRYVQWTGGITGDFEPMKFFRTPPQTWTRAWSGGLLVGKFQTLRAPFLRWIPRRIC